MPTPGEVVSQFTTKSGKPAVLRYPVMEDAQALLDFINTISLEDTFVRFAGEQQALDEEQKYLASEIQLCSTGNAVKLFCFVEGKFAGVTDIHRDTSLLTRRLHSGIFGIIVSKEFRGEGVGTQLITSIVQEAKKHISGLKLIKLDCFANNEPAMALYKKVGFVEAGRIPKALFRQGEYTDEVHMALEI